MTRLPGIALSLLAFALSVTACGGTKRHASTGTTTVVPVTTAATAPSTTRSAPSAPGALQGEALSAAAGDIPDNQVFVLYAGHAFSMKVPEGWARQTAAGQTTFRDKDNIVRVVIQAAPAPTVASVTHELARDHNAHVTTAAHAVHIGSTGAIGATYTTTSAPNPVTGKKLTLTVDRYELGHDGKRAIVDLGTPVGVDNVDAYRLMIESLRLQ